METARINALAQDLETTLRLMDQLIGEVRAIGGESEHLATLHQLAEAIGRRPSLAALPGVLLQAYGEIAGALGGIRLSREAIQVHAVDRLRHTHDKLAEVSSATESAATEMLDGLDRSLAMIDRLEALGASGSAQPADPDGRSLHQALRDEVNNLFGVLQFQDITSQQLRGACDLLAEVEQRLSAVANLFDPSVGADVPLPEVAVALPDTADAGPKTYDAAASTRRAGTRQAMADAILAQAHLAPAPLALIEA
jgi:hypothetical protein